MTTNAIAFYDAQTRRAGLAETVRHDLAQESVSVGQLQLGYSQLIETGRHNIATEQLGYSTLAEQSRHNQATEELGWGQLYETSKHNRATEGIGWANVGLGYYTVNETIRHDKAMENNQRANIALGYSQLGETSTHNRAMEDVAQQNASSAATSAEAAHIQAEVAQRNALSQRVMNWSRAIGNYSQAARDVSSIVGYWTSDRRKSVDPWSDLPNYYDQYGNFIGGQ